METLLIASRRNAKICLIMSSFLLPAFLSFSPTPNLTQVDHELRLKYARQILSSKEYLNLAFTDSDNGVVENFIVSKFREAWPQYSESAIFSIANTLINESNRAQMDPLFVMAVIQQESKFDPTIVGGHGELGLMQIRPKTARWIAAKNKITLESDKGLFVPSTNIKIGILYLKYLNQKYGNAKYSTAAYNMGPKNLRRILASEQEPEIYHSQVFKNYKSFYAKIKSSNSPSRLVAAH